MIKYSVGLADGTTDLGSISLDVEAIEDVSPVIIEGEGENIELLKMTLPEEYGAYGHRIGDETTAFDLSVALTSERLVIFTFELVEGEEIMEQEVKEIPEGVQS